MFAGVHLFMLQYSSGGTDQTPKPKSWHVTCPNPQWIHASAAGKSRSEDISIVMSKKQCGFLPKNVYKAKNIKEDLNKSNKTFFWKPSRNKKSMTKKNEIAEYQLTGQDIRAFLGRTSETGTATPGLRPVKGWQHLVRKKTLDTELLTVTCFVFQENDPTKWMMFDFVSMECLLLVEVHDLVTNS